MQRMARQSAEYEPSVWGNYFIKHPNLASAHQMLDEGILKRVQGLIKQVKGMLIGVTDPLQHMELIDKLQRLGVAYHFEEEIDEALIHILGDTNDNDELYTAALRFQLLRQHRYDAPSSIFNKFKDQQGNFKANICGDIKGLLALYDAAYLGEPGEQILDEAIHFTRSHLNKYYSQATCDHLEASSLARRVRYALETPMHRRMNRLEARNYISIYEKDSKQSQKDLLLELAKLDFHLLQQLHREEIRIISKWYEELGFVTKLSFARDRVVECYFWILGVFFEPQYACGRMMMTKIINMFSFIDDIYDVYGTEEELLEYTDVINRWDAEAANQLKDFLKLPFLSLDKIIKEFEHELASDGVCNYTHYLKEKISETCRGMIQENKWREEAYVPPLRDHLRVTQITTFYPALACTSFLGMGKVATEAAFEWVTSFPRMIDAVTFICRLMDDVAEYEGKGKAKDVACAVDCYMKEHNVSAHEAKEDLLHMVEEAWKVMNQEYLKVKNIPKTLLTRIFNLARMMETIYRNGDHYDHSVALKDRISLLLDQPITF